ncbi:MAG: DEAD/DEAH box helicase family protein [Candidatus Latescibacteria bacterium]|nr:DEAD/DEAH box helicase family protein [Candidatus Latescibacterota bacterium]
MVTLRPYQQDLLRQVQDALDAYANARVMMQLPTGGGKTIIAGHCWLLGSRMGNHCLNQDLQNKRMNRMKGGALNRRVRKFGSGVFCY